ncbi:MAG: hypothetical protein PHQ27_02265 [Victivallales bacterium]|nr:hypothetical protein [Victivallales bacterium]
MKSLRIVMVLLGVLPLLAVAAEQKEANFLQSRDFYLIKAAPPQHCEAMLFSEGKADGEIRKYMAEEHVAISFTGVGPSLDLAGNRLFKSGTIRAEAEIVFFQYDQQKNDYVKIGGCKSDNSLVCSVYGGRNPYLILNWIEEADGGKCFFTFQFKMKQKEKIKSSVLFYFGMKNGNFYFNPSVQQILWESPTHKDLPLNTEIFSAFSHVPLLGPMYDDGAVDGEYRIELKKVIGIY